MLEIGIVVNSGRLDFCYEEFPFCFLSRSRCSSSSSSVAQPYRTEPDEDAARRFWEAMCEVEAEDAEAEDDALELDRLQERVRSFVALCHRSKKGNLTVKLVNGHWVTIFLSDREDENGC